MMHTRRRRWWLGALALLAAACTSGTARHGRRARFHEPPAQRPAGYAPRPPRAVVAAATQRSARTAPATGDELRAAIGGAMSAEQFAQRYGLELAESVSYDPGRAAGLPTIQHSELALDGAELGRLRERGLVVSARRAFGTFADGLTRIYVEDLPLYVTADSVLYAMHRSFESLLCDLETTALIPALDAMLERMRARLASGQPAGASPALRAQLDLYLAVPLSLLRERPAAPVAGASQSDLDAIVAAARRHEGTVPVTLFGASQELDASQFTPRSHYTLTPELGRYFQAMIWLGRSQLRVFDRDERNAVRFARPAADGAVALRALMDDRALAAWRRIDAVERAFVGESDAMVPPQVDALLGDLRVAPGDLAAFARVPDDAVAGAVRSRGFGVHRIASQLLVGGLDATLEQPVTFALLPQRYTVDAHVLSNVVYDRAGGGRVQRLMPSPLDAAFAALGNDLAGELLRPELATWGYARDLHAMRALVDAHEASYWQSSLYTAWLGALRTLSPATALGDDQRAGLPEIAGTEAWNRRLLGTQLASWAELRHNTVLYTEQSYTGVLGCSYPEAYVEPYPAFWASMERFASQAASVLRGLDGAGAATVRQGLGWAAEFGRIAARLRAMAEKERRGERFAPDDLAFINDAVTYRHNMCGGTDGLNGWYARLFYRPFDALEAGAIVTDVHTQPTDAAGNEVGRVLHVGTGTPRLMVATVDNGCDGPRAYAGVVSSYYELTTEHYARLTDAPWRARFGTADAPHDVPWMRMVLAGERP